MRRASTHIHIYTYNRVLESSNRCKEFWNLFTILSDIPNDRATMATNSRPRTVSNCLIITWTTQCLQEGID